MGHGGGSDQGVDNRQSTACGEFSPTPRNGFIDVQNLACEHDLNTVNPKAETVRQGRVGDSFPDDAFSQFAKCQHAHEQPIGSL